jgi:DNA polymerase
VPVAAPVPRVAAEPVAASGLPGIEMMEWDALAQTVTACRACQLCDGRRQPLLGAGDQQADWLIVGEPPNEDEDLAGEPFVGDGGKLLDNMLRSLGLTRRDRVYLAHVLKCRPTTSGLAGPDHVAQCEPFLRRQVELLQPRVILAMGRLAVQTLLASSEPLGKLRGRAHQYHGIPVVATYHPMYLLRNPADKGRAWADLCLAQSLVRG